MEEQNYFQDLAVQLQEIVSAKKHLFVSHLSQGSNNIAIEIKIQCSDRPASISINLTDRTSSWRVDRINQFDPARFTKESAEAIRHYIDKCKFYTLPIEILFYFKADNTICGKIVTNFRFRDHGFKS